MDSLSLATKYANYIELKNNFYSNWIFAGTKEERGLIAWEKEMSLEQSELTENEPASSTFDFPLGMDALRR